MAKPIPSSFELLSAFTGALSHRLRSSLSVVSSDLEYLATMVPPGECERALSRVREMSELLARVREGLSAENLEGDVAWSDCIPGLCMPVICPPEVLSMSVPCPPHLLRLVVALLRDLSESLQVSGLEASVVPTPAQLLFHGTHTGPEAMLKTGDFHSFTVLADRLGVESVEAPLLDAVLSNIGCDIEIHVDGRHFNAVFAFHSHG